MSIMDSLWVGYCKKKQKTCKHLTSYVVSLFRFQLEILNIGTEWHTYLKSPNLCGNSTILEALFYWHVDNGLITVKYIFTSHDLRLYVFKWKSLILEQNATCVFKKSVII